jgi:hypothetical protein
MEEQLIKPGPIAKYNFGSYIIGHEVTIEPLKQSSFKSMLSKYNNSLEKEYRHKYSFELSGKKIIARRVK